MIPLYLPGNLDVGMSGNQILTDAQGRRLGYDPTSDQIINEILGAYLIGSMCSATLGIDNKIVYKLSFS
jgi:hypothetical protein